MVVLKKKLLTGTNHLLRAWLSTCVEMHICRWLFGGVGTYESGFADALDSQRLDERRRLSISGYAIYVHLSLCGYSSVVASD